MNTLSEAAKRAAVTTRQTTRIVYSTDNSIYQVEPAGVALPTTTSEIAALVRANAESLAPKPIVARGGGTGTNGQSLTDGIVIDVKRNLNQIISIDPEHRVAVVEPGVVTARLNAELAKYGLFWAPHTSTLNRATVGGMISTDAAGKGSLVHGRANRHVISLDVILDDGTEWTARPTPLDEVEKLASQDNRVGRLWRSLLDLPLAHGAPIGSDLIGGDLIEGNLIEGDLGSSPANYGLPELARGFSGYGIDRVRSEETLDPLPLLCGAEGTLAVLTAATLSLTPLPSKTMLVVASYDSFADALADAVELRATKPTAIESFDETTLERGRSSPAWPALGQVVGDHRGSVLLLEYTDEQAENLDQVTQALADTGRSRAHQTLTEATDRAAAWKVRADAVGLLAKVASGGPKLSARPTAFVEDCAVPVKNMGKFIAGFREILDRFGLEYGMFGHADVGCVHVRPALDLTSPDHVDLIRAVTDEVVALVAANDGILWGEHGRGFRGDSVTSFLSPETISVMEQVKLAFDPNDLFNPGKLYRPFGSETPIIAVDEPPLRGEANRSVPVALRNDFGSAFACNGNGLCHDYAAAEVMCPSYKATGDPELSPKGRADLLRSWLAKTEQNENTDQSDRLANEIAENLHQCLSCSACTGRCPVEVDIPELKSRFLERYYATRRRPLSHAVLSRFENLAVLAGRAPQGAKRGTAFGALLAGKTLGLVNLPVPASTPKRQLPAFVNKLTSSSQHGPGRSDDHVVIMPDVFTSILEPATLHKAFDVLVGLGFHVSVAPFVASGKFDHVKGKRRQFAKVVRAQQAMVDSIVASGARPVVIEPAVALLHDHEYPNTIDGYPSDHVVHLVDLLLESKDKLKRSVPSGSDQTVSLLGHCTERATAPDKLAAWTSVLQTADYNVETPDLGCCGMAGIFGHEATNLKLSKDIWQLSWAPHLATAHPTADLSVATGYSCRSQTHRFADSRNPVQHPIHLL